MSGKLITKIGSEGKADGQFNAPYGLALHKETLFVADSGNKRVSVFDRSGDDLKFVRHIGVGQLIDPASC